MFWTHPVSSSQLQMDKLPSRHAISEVMSWISLMESVILKDEEDIRNAIGYKAIHEYLQKYKVVDTWRLPFSSI
jgi:hypothetical protein